MKYYSRDKANFVDTQVSSTKEIILCIVLVTLLVCAVIFAAYKSEPRTRQPGSGLLHLGNKCQPVYTMTTKPNGHVSWVLRYNCSGWVWGWGVHLG